MHANYQYKAFGIPWLGLKRGLEDEAVVASYGSILAINYKPKETIKNLGTVIVDLKLYEGIIGKLKVQIIANC